MLMMRRIAIWGTSCYRAYDGLLARHTLKTTTVSGTVLGLAGDGMTQAMMLRPPEQYDVRRGFAFGLFGGALTGPVNFVWLRQLNSIVRHLAPGGGAVAIIAKVTIQSLVFQPMIYVPLFLSFTAAVWDRPWTASLELARIEYRRTLRSVWAFWTPVCLATFSLLPLRQQAVFFSAVSLCWNAILSFLSNPEPLRLQESAVSADYTREDG